MIEWTMDAALEAEGISDILVSTDDQEIIDLCKKKERIEAPFIRPAELAGDDALMKDVLKHAYEWFLENSGKKVEAIILLQPTSPFRTGLHISEALAMFKKSKVNSLISVVELPHIFHPDSLMEMDDHGGITPLKTGEKVTRRQDKPKLYARNGPAILIVRPEVIYMESLYAQPSMGYLMRQADSIDIDTMDDFRFAEAYVAVNKMIETH